MVLGTSGEPCIVYDAYIDVIPGIDHNNTMYFVERFEGTWITEEVSRGFRHGPNSLAIDPLYAATKAALISLVRSVAAANDGGSVRINAICPGVVQTAIVPEAMSGSVPMMPPATMAAEILDLLSSGASGEIRVKLNEETPAFHVEPNTLGR